MGNSNLDILIIAGGLVAIILTITLMFLLRAIGSSRKQTKSRLEKFRNRFGERKRLKGEHVRSIRLNQEQTGFAAQLASLLPKRDELQKRLEKAGTSIALSRYATISGLLAVATLISLIIAGLPPMLAFTTAIAVGAGLPHIVINSMIKSRMARFTKQFPEAMDLMVRGLKSGLPVNECISNVAQELPAPTGVEFRKITDSMRLGKQLEEALWETADRLDTPDFKFFVISLVVQKETGGNLGETLGNLSMILRQRQAMKLKVKALSSEAKASAWIVGILPFVMLGTIMVMNYDYGIVLFTNPKAIFAGSVALVWMTIGVFIMSRMIKFEV